MYPDRQEDSIGRQASGEADGWLVRSLVKAEEEGSKLELRLDSPLRPMFCPDDIFTLPAVCAILAYFY